MQRLYIIPAAILTLGIASPAFAEDKVSTETVTKTSVEKDADGDYHKKQTQTSESTDANGTTTSSKTKIQINSDSDGNADKKVVAETSTDPKGLMNKTKTSVTDSVKYKDGNVETKHQKKVNGKTVEEEKTEEKAAN